MLPLLRDKQIWTFGADSPDIDWEAAWKLHLQELPNYNRGGGCCSSRGHNHSQGITVGLGLDT